MSDDRDLDKLRALPGADLDDVAAERVRRRALAALAEERRLAARPVERAWSRFVTPVLLAAACSCYLAWSFSQVGFLYR